MCGIDTKTIGETAYVSFTENGQVGHLYLRQFSETIDVGSVGLILVEYMSDDPIVDQVGAKLYAPEKILSHSSGSMLISKAICVHQCNTL